MKNFQDLLKDLHENEELRIEAKKALGNDALIINEDQYSAVVAFGKDHGYDFTEEDIHMNRAANRSLDDSELEFVSGGGTDDYCTCNDKGKCNKDWGCYNDYTCRKSQMTSWGGRGWCTLDYACLATWNRCFISNKCLNLNQCKGDAY